MNKTLKKTLSIILTILMIVTTVPFALAADTTQHTYNLGDIIQYGSYPQSKVTDEKLIAELNALAPEWDNWTSYGYYSGTGAYGTMTQGDWMRYTDVTYNGNKYRGVKFTQYRPENTYYSYSYSEYQYKNGYSTNTVYWFKFEPIDWRVLDPATGLVMCETIIDSQPYSNTSYYNSDLYFNDTLYTNYANDYETSSIRKWLNNDFYNIAFSESEKKEINATNDKISLLSYDEINLRKYGFDAYKTYSDPARRAKGSDYAKSQGLSVAETPNYGKSIWLLSSPGSTSKSCCYVYFGGKAEQDYSVTYTIYGIRPTFVLNLQSANPHNPKEKNTITQVEAKAPTCTEIGWDAYECCTACDYTTYAEIPATDHDWSNKDGVCANACGYVCPHEKYTDGKCDVCAYECPHENYTDGKCDVCKVARADYTAFDAAVEKLQEILAREDLLDGPKQGYTSALNNVISIIGYNRPEEQQMAVNNGTQTLNGYIAAIEADIENGSMIKADFTYMTALFAEINELIGSDPGKIIPSQRGLYTGTLAYYNGCSNSPTFTQQNYNSNISHEKDLEALLAGLKDGSMLVADYTEIDEAIKAIDEALETATINNEMNAELEDIKADLAALKADVNTSKLELENSGLIERAAAIAEIMNACANGNHSFTVYTESKAAECEANAEETAACDNGCGATDTREVENTALGHADEDGDTYCDNGGEQLICPDCGRPVHAYEGIPQFICFIIMFINLVKSMFA